MREAICNITTLFILIGSLVCSAVQAADGQYLPQQREQNGLAYLSGGIGEREADAMRAAKQHYRLALTFAVRESKAFLSDVQVRIESVEGNTKFDVVSVGGMVLVNLPAGSYKAEFEDRGRIIIDRFQVPRKGTLRKVYYWPRLDG
ncbi:MAG: hypothetical protein ABIP64_05135 [Burkholderiales bacterium]